MICARPGCGHTLRGHQNDWPQCDCRFENLKPCHCPAWLSPRDAAKIAAGKKLAVLALQSARYSTDQEFADAVDAVLANAEERDAD